MQHRFAAEVVDRMLQDVRGCNEPFGGVIMVFAGDFRQCLPVVPKGSQAQIRNACLTSSALWRGVIRLRLTINMRLRSTPMSPREFAEAEGFARWLLEIGDGKCDVQGKDAVHIPPELLANSVGDLLGHVYPDLARYRSDDAAMDYFKDRAILAPTNSEVDALNGKLLAELSGEARTYLSADYIVENEGAQPQRGRLSNQQLWPIEYLNSIDFGGYPLHRTLVKVGSTVLLLRNLDPSAGLCNGTRIYVTELHSNVIRGRILGGDYHSNECLIPRIKLDSPRSANLPFTLRHTQFPIQTGLALTIHKPKGSPLQRLGSTSRNRYSRMVSSMLACHERASKTG